MSDTSSLSTADASLGFYNNPWPWGEGSPSPLTSSDFWSLKQHDYPFSSIFRTRNTMRIKWAVVSNSDGNFPQRFLDDLIVLPYNSPFRDHINHHIYSSSGVPIPSELQDIIDYFMYPDHYFSPWCLQAFLHSLCYNLSNTNYTIPEKVIFFRKKALFYFVPPILFPNRNYTSLYLTPSRKRHLWKIHLHTCTLPLHSTFEQCVQFLLPQARQIYTQ